MKNYPPKLSSKFDPHFKHYPSNLKRALEVHVLAKINIYLVDRTPNHFYSKMWPDAYYLNTFIPDFYSVTQFPISKYPGFDSIKSQLKSESITDVKVRINNASPQLDKMNDSDFSMIQYLNFLNESSTNILKKTADGLQFSFQGILNVLSLTEAIRRLDGVLSPQIPHVYEAISYVSDLYAFIDKSN